ncbi:MAG: serine hydrolase domain-containing protein [Gemmatimonadota bacterium]
MISTRLLVLLVFVWLPAALPAQFTPPRGGRAGFSAERLRRLDRVLEGYVEREEVAGVVALVLRRGAVAYERAFGWADRESGRKMTTDAIFRIASQTKALTSVAAMMLVEEGKLGLADPVSRYIRSFARSTVAARTDTGVAIVPARRAITIRDLLTHTAGISYGTDELVAERYRARGLGPAAGDGIGFYTADREEPICETMERLGTLPFVRQPGEAWVYGYATDILGCVVERASGTSLDAFFRERIIGPLGMKDTHFFLPSGKRGRLVTVYASDTGGRYVRSPEGARGQGHYVDGPRRSYSGGAGLLSTAADYARFLQMLLNGGVHANTRLLSPAAVSAMTTNQTGTLFGNPGGGIGFGLGFQVAERDGADGLASEGTWGWGGAYGSVYKVDPAERLVLVLMIQLIPNRTDIRDRFPSLVYQALVEPAARR